MKSISWKLCVKYLLIIGILFGNAYANNVEYVKDSYIVVLKKKDQVIISSKNTNESVKERAIRLLKASIDTGKSAQISSSKSVSSKLGVVYEHVLQGFSAILSKSEKEKLEQNPEVKYIEKNIMVHINNEVPEIPIDTDDLTIEDIDTNSIMSWGIDRIDQVLLPLDGVYHTNTDADGVHVYIVDTGIRASHEEFAGRVGNGYDFIDNDEIPDDGNGHGTHVAGTVGGTLSGVAKGVTLHGIKILPSSGTGSLVPILQGLDWVKENHISPAVVNMSVGAPKNTALNDAVKNLINSGVTVVVSAGNDNRDACKGSPSSSSLAITVAATTDKDTKASYSNYGTCVDIYAPGSYINSASITSDSSYKDLSGTSMASPHVAGVAALYLSSNSEATPSEVKAYIIDNSTKEIIKNNVNNTPNRFLLSIKRDNLEPIAKSFQLSTTNGKSIHFTLGVHNEKPGVEYQISTNPSHGSLVGTVPNLTYIPTSGYYGDDSFQYQAIYNNKTTEANVTIVNLDTSGCISRSTLDTFIKNDVDIRDINTTCIENMSNLFKGRDDFNQDISKWDTSNVTNMSRMFYKASNFNKPIGNWDTSRVISMEGMFYGASNFNQPIGNWNTSNVASMRLMFYAAGSFNKPIGDWDTSNVQNMSSLFSFARKFDQPIGNWDTSKVISMEGMFYGASNFNQPIGNWDTSNVRDMEGMFIYSYLFNQPIGDWDTSNVTNMSSMFYGAFVFNQPITDWDISNVTTLYAMFSYAGAFNQPLNKWDTSSVTNMRNLFGNSKATGHIGVYPNPIFNKPLDNWDTSKVTNMNSMFLNNKYFNQPLDKWNISKLINGMSMFGRENNYSTNNYSKLLNSWSKQNVENVEFRYQTPKYNQSAVNARNKLISQLGWKISDGGLDNTPIPTAPSNLDATNIEQTTATLTWNDNSNNEQGFRIYNGTTLVATVNANITTYNLTGLTANTEYSYSVKAYNGAGESAASSKTFKTTMPVTKSIITSPANNARVNADETLTLRWENHGASRNRVYVGAEVDGKWNRVKSVYTSGESLDFKLPTGFTRAYVDVYSYDGSKFLGLSRHYLYPAPPATKSIITSPANNARVNANETLTLRWENHGASRQYLYIKARINNKWASYKSIYNAEGTSLDFTLPSGFEMAYAHIGSYDKNNKYLGSSRTFLYPKTK